MGYQLVYELESLEVPGPAFIEPLWVCCPDNRIGGLVIMNFLGACSSPNHVLTRRFTINLAEQPGFAFYN